jgi:hypothetical protein
MARDTSATKINHWRLSSQQLHQPRWRQPERVVQWLGGVQAQYPDWAHWSIGLRLCSDAAEVRRPVAVVRQAIAERRIVRTWAFRGTLHYIAASDVQWLLPLLAPAIVKRNSRRYRQLGLDEDTFAQSSRVIYNALQPGEPLARAEIARALENAGVSAQGQRIHYLVQRAALDGLVCHGPSRERKPTYVLVSQWIGAPRAQTSSEPLLALVERYFSGHGPASVQDFAWWSGLPVSAARKALSLAQSLVRCKAKGTTLWAGQKPSELQLSQTAYLLSPYDEWLLGYKDRSSSLDPAYTKLVNAGGGMPRPTIIVNGQVVGTWKRAIRADGIVAALELFHDLTGDEYAAIDAAVHRYGAFHSLPIEIQ